MTLSNSEEIVPCNGDCTCSGNDSCTMVCDDSRICQDSTLNCPSGHDCSINCIGDSNSCDGAVINAKYSHDTTLICNKYASCKDLILNCPQHYNCRVICEPQGGESCLNITVNGALSSNVYMDCDETAYRLCYSSNIYCGDSCDILCNGTNNRETCGDLFIDMTQTNQLKLYCDNSCSFASAEIITSSPTTTTNPPTTSSPTTSNPTTSNPTTYEPTSSTPTTSEPTTAEPTTFYPTTSDPTTSAEPTTLSPTISVPATLEPTTASLIITAPTAGDQKVDDVSTTNVIHNTNGSKMQQNDDGLLWTVIYIVSGLIIICIICLCFFFIRKQQERKNKNKNEKETNKTQGNIEPITPVSQIAMIPYNATNGEIHTNITNINHIINRNGEIVHSDDDDIDDEDDNDDVPNTDINANNYNMRHKQTDGGGGDINVNIDENEFIVHGDDNDNFHIITAGGDQNVKVNDSMMENELNEGDISPFDTNLNKTRGFKDEPEIMLNDDTIIIDGDDDEEIATRKQ